MTPRAALVRTWRGRLPVVAVVVACVAGVVAAVTGAANPVSAVQFLLPGHWVYNSSLGAVFHVDGSTGDVDASAQVPGGSGDQVFQGDTSGYVVGDSRITEFGKSSLSVEESTSPPSREVPVGVETAGGPYLVYREDGKVVRLGDRHTVLSLGGPVGTPVATKDGTLWLPRTGAGLLCQLPSGAKNVSCPVLLPKGHTGALTVVGERLVFVDTTKDTLHVVEKDGLGEPHDLGLDAQDDARLASTDVDGRLAMLDGEQMHLVDAGLSNVEPAAPVTVDLTKDVGAGEYAGPVSTGSVVAVVNRTTSTLVTYDSEGKQKQSKELPAEKGEARLTRGEDDRIYIDGAEGEHVVVVDRDGQLTDVPIRDEGAKEKTEKPGNEGQGKPVETPKPGSTKPPVVGQDPPKPTTTQPKPPTTTQPRPPVAQETQPPAPPPVQPPVVPPSPPGAPTVVNATAADASATVSWGPAQDNRSAITGYRISWAGGETTVGAGARTAVIPGLANGTTYVFTVSAVNGVGAGPGAASNPVTPVAPVRPAGQATNVQALIDGGRALVTWNAPADMGGGTFTHYIVTATGQPEVTVTGTAAGFDVTPGTMTFTVRAVTTDSGGQQFVGATATTTAEAPDHNGTATLTRGSPTQLHCGGDPDCAWMRVELTGMQPNARYTLQPHSSSEYYWNEGGWVDTDANGNGVSEQFAYHEEGHTVWVVATSPDGVEFRTNDLVWETAG